MKKSLKPKPTFASLYIIDILKTYFTVTLKQDLRANITCIIIYITVVRLSAQTKYLGVSTVNKVPTPPSSQENHRKRSFP